LIAGVPADHAAHYRRRMNDASYEVARGSPDGLQPNLEIDAASPGCIAASVQLFGFLGSPAPARAARADDLPAYSALS